MIDEKHINLAILSLLFLFLSQLSCTEEQAEQSMLKRSSPNQEGPYAVGNTTFKTIDTARERALTFEIWYPSIENLVVGESPSSFEQTEPARRELAALYELAPEQCPTQITNSIRDGKPLTKNSPYPLIIFSHCLNCGRYSSFSLAERLASHGMVVMSVDHAGSLPFTPTATGEELSPNQLATRVQDLNFILNSALNSELFADSELLKKLSIDHSKLGVFGHSFGSVTAAFFADQEPRIKAVAGLAAPMQNPLFPGFTIADLNRPSLLVLAEEDNSIGELGNRLIRSNFEMALAPTWRVDLSDAGHWSLSDLCGLTEAFSPGCGIGTRHSEKGVGEAFEYLPVADGIAITQNYLTAFFQAYLTQRQDALTYLETTSSDPRVSIYPNP